MATPTSVWISCGGQENTVLLRGDQSLNLGAWTRLGWLAREVAEGEMSAEVALSWLRFWKEQPNAYSHPVVLMGYLLASSSAACLFGGGWREVMFAAVLGLLVGLLGEPMFKKKLPPLLVEGVVAAVVAALAVAASAFGLSAHVLIVSGVVVLLPGFSFTFGFLELAARHPVSGAARLAGAISTLGALGGGVALGGRAVSAWEPLPTWMPEHLPVWAEPLALLVAGASFVILLKGLPRQIWGVMLASVAAFLVAKATHGAFGGIAGALSGALTLAIAGRLYAMVTDQPEEVVLVPGLMLLVPGGMGLFGVKAMLGADTLVGVQSLFEMALVAVGLVAGLLLVPPRWISRSAKRRLLAQEKRDDLVRGGGGRKLSPKDLVF